MLFCVPLFLDSCCLKLMSLLFAVGVVVRI